MRSRPLAVIAAGIAVAAGSILVGDLGAQARTSQSALPGGTLVLACSGCPASPMGSSLYTLTPRGRLRKIPGTDGGSRPSWSPDGRSIVYSVRGHELRVIAANGARSRRLTGPFPIPGDDAPDWAPDGRTIAFVRYVPSAIGSYRGSLWRVPAAGGRATQLHAPRYSLHDPSWSPDARRIAYSDNRQKLWVVAADGSGQRSLGPRDLRGSSPRWSPDGRRVAFIEYGKVLALSVLEVETSRVRRLFVLDQSSQVFGHAWSPDGRWLAFARQLEFACGGVPPPGLCLDFEVLAIRFSDGARRVVYRADDGGPAGIDWRR